AVADHPGRAGRRPHRGRGATAARGAGLLPPPPDPHVHRPDAGRGSPAPGMMAGMETGPYSVAFPRRWWYPVARSSELGRRPLAVTLMDTPLAVFRGAGGEPSVLLDRCAHRNYPLSLGRVTGDGVLECGYHGWTYDGGGRCVRVPGLADGGASPAHTRRV